MSDTCNGSGHEHSITRATGERPTTMHGRAGTGHTPGSALIAVAALAVAVDRVVAVIRRHVLADEEPSAWITLGRGAAAAARITGLAGLYLLRFALAAPETARGLRRIVLDAAPLPELPETPASETAGPPCTKKAPCSPCTALTRTTGTAAEPAGSPPNWPRRPGYKPEPPAAICTPSWTAGHHDRGSAR
jgi:hypothetical protein